MRDKKEFPLVTVEMLTYKKFDYLEAALNSVFAQDYPNIEIIISDDGSPNFYKEYIENIINKKTNNIKNVQIIHHKVNLGTVKNLNNCIKLSSGKYFIGLSSDDLFADERVISDVVNYFEKSGALIITSKRAVFENNLNDYKVLPEQKDIQYFYNDKLFQRLVIGNFISGACTFYSKELFKKMGLFDEEYILLEDYPYYLFLARNNIKFHFLDRITVFYRLGGISTSKQINPVLKKDGLLAIKKEILPYPELINKKLYQYKQFQLELAESRNKISLKMFMKYPILYTQKILEKVGLYSFLSLENLLQGDKNEQNN